jgi:hypothetical protein
MNSHQCRAQRRIQCDWGAPSPRTKIGFQKGCGNMGEKFRFSGPASYYSITMPCNAVQYLVIGHLSWLTHVLVGFASLGPKLLRAKGPSLFALDKGQFDLVGQKRGDTSAKSGAKECTCMYLYAIYRMYTRTTWIVPWRCESCVCFW